MKGLSFSDRIKLSSMYYDWVNIVADRDGVKVEMCPANVIAFLMSNDMLDLSEVRKKLKEYKREKEL